jgi:hypothetical protein
MKPVLLSLVLFMVAACASKPNNSMQDPSQIKAEAKARDEFAKSLPKPVDR